MALYLDHFGLREPPFRITPHADFFFDGADRGATLEGLMYAILHDEGIVKVSGEIGSGKTTLCRVLIERLPPEVETVFLANPSYSRAEILHAIAAELGLPPVQSPAESALRELQGRLIETYASGRRVVVLIDEAHAMPEETLEQVRLLSNLESSRHKLLQIVLFGQPELDAALAKTSMRQLRDRITHGFRTRPLTEPEVASYVSFRMRAAGYKGPDIFSPAAIRAIARAAGGLTRRVNVLADKALLAAFAANKHAVTPREVRAAIQDSEFASVAAPRPRIGAIAGAVALVLVGALAGAGLLALLQGRDEPPAAAARPAPQQSPQPATQQPPAAPGAAPAAVVAASAPEIPKAPPPPRLSEEQLQRIAGYATGGQALLRERVLATREKLLSEPDESYGIELFIAENSDPARTERFLQRARDLVPLEDIYVLPERAAGKSGPRYRLHVAYSAFHDLQSAQDAVRRLPPKYQKSFALQPRRFAELRAPL